MRSLPNGGRKPPLDFQHQKRNGGMGEGIEVKCIWREKTFFKKK